MTLPKHGQVLVEGVLATFMGLILFFALVRIAACVKVWIGTSSTWQELVVRYHEKNHPKTQDLKDCHESAIFHGPIHCKINQQSGFQIKIHPPPLFTPHLFFPEQPRGSSRALPKMVQTTQLD